MKTIVSFISAMTHYDVVGYNLIFGAEFFDHFLCARQVGTEFSVKEEFFLPLDEAVGNTEFSRPGRPADGARFRQIAVKPDVNLMQFLKS